MNFLNMLLNRNQNEAFILKSDTSEKILINGLSLLKMLKHAKQGILLEVIGIMLGQKIDKYTIEVFDVFPTPQIATGQNVQTTDEAFQALIWRLSREQDTVILLVWVMLYIEKLIRI